MQSEQFKLHAQIEERHWWFVARRRILRELVAAVVPSVAESRSVSPRLTASLGETRLQDQSTPHRPIVVDIGCGTGANLAAFAGDYRCAGIDTSPEAIDLARSRYPGTTFICGQAPEGIRSWLSRSSVVLLTDVLEHVPDDFGMLESIVQACPEGSQLVLTVPADMQLWSPHDESFGHYRRYDLDNFSALWESLPLRTRLVSYFNSRLYPAVRAARAISRRRGEAAGEANTDFSLPIAPVNAALESIFAGERKKLRRAIDANRTVYKRGVSLVAVLERIPAESTAESAKHEFSAPTPAELAYL
jgi:SAM-dependent methyltransferase